MSIALYLKDRLKNIPPSVGRLINKMPYERRPGIGKIYHSRRTEIKSIEDKDPEEQQKYILRQLKPIVNHAYHHVRFYKDFYDSKGFHPDQLNHFEDIQRIPIVTKSILNEYDLEDRSFDQKGRYIANTGGSSGTPYSFYILPSSMGHEWAHMHQIWEELDFGVSDLRLTFAGRSDLKDELIKYDVIRNSFLLDIYSDYKLVSARLKDILKKYKIRYLHGYPSLIYDFALYCEQEDPELKALLSKHLEGAFLGSEFPHKIYRDTIKEVFGIRTISWYGHTERCVLAYEKNEEYLYEPFLTYGYAEAIPVNGEYQLAGTSYHNFTSPFIRYNTEDLISDITEDEGILKSFKISKGRSGEFVLDKNGKRINLTGLIFGRHHELFNHASHLQVKQVGIGRVEIHYVAPQVSPVEAAALFDDRNVELDFTFVPGDEPVRTAAGKVRLLID